VDDNLTLEIPRSVHWSTDHAEVTVNLILDDCEMAWRIVLDMDVEDVDVHDAELIEESEEAELIVDSQDEFILPCGKEEKPSALHHQEQADREQKQVETLKQQIQALRSA